MAWSRDEERLLAQIEQRLVEEDPRLVARLESFNRRAGRGEAKAKGETPRRRPRRVSLVILMSWLLLATLVAMMLILVLRHEVALAGL